MAGSDEKYAGFYQGDDFWKSRVNPSWIKPMRPGNPTPGLIGCSLGSGLYHSPAVSGKNHGTIKPMV